MESDAARRLVFRTLQRDERGAVQDVFDGLSARSRTLRFHGAKPHLTERDLAALTDVGCCGRHAVVAVDRESGRAVGIARYVADGTNGVEAEVAYAVADEWQARGVGRRLIVELARIADSKGVARFRGLVSGGNARSLALLDYIGSFVERGYEDGAFRVVVAIRP